MSRFNPDFIQELNNTDITRLLDLHGIKLRGGNHVEKQIPCVSPAHDDKNPSMSVNIDSGQFHCHGCGVPGSGCVSMFATMTGQDSQRDFRDVVEGLSQILGIDPVYSNSNDKTFLKSQSIKETLFGLVQQSMKTPFFPDDRQAVSAFLSERGVTNSDRETAKIGFIPRNFHTSPFAKENEELLKEIGILKISERTGNTYSPFGGRIVFPIANETGEIIGIAGRRLGDEGGPKYINSDESPVFHKSKVLYGLYNTLKGLEAGEKLDRLIIVEGYMDAITSQTRGFSATVATMGTAATPQHFKVMARKAKAVTFVFDPDDAGKRAGERALMNALPYAGQMDIRFAEMPADGDIKLDPDQMLKTLGPEAYGKVVDSALPIPNYAARYILGSNEADNLMELLQGGLEERGKQVFASTPPGITRQLLSIEIARQIGDRLGLALSPEHIGMNIDYEQQIVDLISENEDLRVAPDKQVKPTSKIQTIDQVSAAKKVEEARETSLANDTSKVELSKANVAPFTMVAISKDQPAPNKWVMINSGQFGLVSEVSDGKVQMTMSNGESMTAALSDCITLLPRTVISSKYDGHFHSAGDQILHMGSGWFGGWPISHYDAAKGLLQSNGNDRSLLEAAAMLALEADEVATGTLQASLVAVRSMSIDDLKKKIGMSESMPPMANAPIINKVSDSNNEKMPHGLLINTPPRVKDFVTSKELGGKVLVVDEDVNGELFLKDTVSNSRHKLNDHGKLLVIKAEGRTLSKIDTHIATIGQPIFKVTKEGKWLSSVQSQWIDEKMDQIEKQQARSESLSP